MIHKLVCQYGYTHAQCDCAGPHTTRTIRCTDPDHQKEHDVSEQDKPRDMATNTDPELNKAFSEEAGVDTAYAGITPAPDPDLEDEDDADEEGEPDGVTAFLVVIQADGTAQISTKLDIPMTVLREATLLDVRRACDELLFNLRNQAVSENTVMLMQQVSQQVAEQQRVAKIQQKLASKGIQVPGGIR